MIHRIAIVNRGEPARRLIHAVRELAAERGEPIRAIALHTEAERGALFVREADEAVTIAPTAEGGGNPYLDLAALRRALVASRADAAWVGWGFVAEDPRFPELCAELGVTFVGPPADVMRRLGDKVAAKRLAESVGVPVAPWSGGPVDTPEEAIEHAAAIGFPLMVKASAGGGGRGIRVVRSEGELAEAIERAQAEAQRSFGDPAVFMESLVTGARHVEVQVIADHHGTAWAVGVRDCSVQRRNQKLIEESSSPALTPEQARELGASAAELARAAGYRNAATVEFLYQPHERAFAFLEVNTRLQVEHPVTELVTGLDLVKLQLHVAAGGRLEGAPPGESGHAIEARLNAEDPERDFAPAPGTIELLSLPSGPGIRVDTGVAEGDTIPPEYDSMIAKIIAWGRDRDEARARLRRALEQTTVVIRGGTTNRAFLLALLEHPEVARGTADTGWVDRVGADGGHLSARNADLALVAVAVDAYDAEESLGREQFYATARRGRPQAGHEAGRTVELRHRGQEYRLRVAQVAPRRYRVGVDGASVDVGVERLRRFESRLTVAGRGHRVVAVAAPPDHLVEVDGAAHRVSRDEGGVVRAPAPALVVAVRAGVGETVEAGQTVVVLESMKTEMAIVAPFAGRVREVRVSDNTQVGAGAPLLSLEPSAEGAAPVADSPRVDLRALAGEGALGDGADAPEGPRARALALLDALRSLIMGYDVSAEEARALVGELERARGELAHDDPELVRAELSVLALFGELADLVRNRAVVSDGDEAQEERVHSPREHFHAYLRSLDVEREGLPEPLREQLERAVAHYGVEGLEPSVELAEAAYRIFLSQERAASQLPAITALLEHRARAEEVLRGPLADELRETLDRLILATQLRHPSVGELARSVRFRAFDQPLVAAAREEVYAGARQQLQRLADAPDAADYAERIEAVVASPEPLVSLIAEQSRNGSDEAPLLEILTRRYYKIRRLEEVRALRARGRRFIAASYRREGRRVGLLTTLADASDLADAARAAADLLPEVDGEGNVVVDLYLARRGPDVGEDALGRELGAALDSAGLPGSVRRVALAVASGDGARTHHFTFRRGENGAGPLAEERVVRGLHPMISRRLRFWRLSAFEVARLPSAEDVYLFHCVGREDPGEERFAALAEVRDLTPVRDEEGRLVALPEVERVLAACLDGIRRAQAERSPRRRLLANHVFLYVWPELRLPPEELLAAARRLAPLTVGLELEEVLVQVRTPAGEGEGEEPEAREQTLRFSYQPATGVTVALTQTPTTPLAPLGDYRQKVLAARRRGAVYPYELVPLLEGAGGTFTEHDLDDEGRLTAVDRPPGGNRAGIVVGVVSTPTKAHPEGMTRVALLGDPTKALGSVAEPECARIIAALDLAERMGAPVEWLALSAGAKISYESGTENMDWVAAVLRRLIDFTQAGNEVNVVVAGINVGAQPYWNAEATMLMHTRGILVMTPDSAMVLTGKQALDYSGGVSAEDNFGIGGYDRIMGPNGQAQYWAPDLARACELLHAHYAHTYVAPGERFPREVPSADPPDRDVRSSPHSGPGSDITSVGEIFSAELNAERKRPFDIRSLMGAVIDQDHPPLERWAEMADAQTAVVFDAHLGGQPVALLGIESRPVPRHGLLPADGPESFSAGTLFPLSSKKAARAINAASGNRPLVVLANLSGFDGSPESLRKRQLEYGAEIGRAVVNFSGPIVFCVVGRYHGGAFVVFSGALNEQMQVLAVEGSYASVIGGAPAAAVVFAGEVAKRTEADPRVADLEARLSQAPAGERAALRAELAEVRAKVRSQRLGEVADEFDTIHSVHRAQEVGSVHRIIPAERLRPELIEAVRRGMAGGG